MVKMINICCEGLNNPIGIDAKNPCFSYELISNKQNVLQVSYQIIVYKMGEIVWDSGLVLSSQSQNIIYNGEVLNGYTQYDFTIAVEVENDLGEKEKATGNGFFETAKINQVFKSYFVGVKDFILEKGKSPAPIVFKKEFKVTKEIKRARIYATASGIYEIYLQNKLLNENNKRYFAPGFTSYNKNLAYQVYDCTGELVKGQNTINVVVCSGWAVGVFGFTTENANFSNEMGLMLELRIDYLDGTSKIIKTDKDFLVAKSCQFKEASFYHGEVMDNNITFDQLDYEPVSLINVFKDAKLKADYQVGVKEIKRLKPVKMIITPKNEIVYDFGQNFAGVVKIKLNGKKGQVIRVRHAELLDKDGNFYTRNLRKAKAEYQYICSDGYQEYAPHFTYMGFRYCQVEGLDDADINSVEGIVLSSDLKEVGNFTCSNPYLNRLQENIVWSERSNFFDIPTDCPQRDERLGWTGDIAVFSRSAIFNMNVKRFFEKWLLDLRSDQNKEGAIGHIVPYVKCIPQTIPTAGWSDAAIFVPWNSYIAYGDKAILEDNYECMKKLVDCEYKYATSDKNSENKFIWTKPFQFGDWLAPNESNPQWMAKAKELATTYFANSAHIVSLVAGILGKTSDEKKYSELFKKISNKYLKLFINKDGSIKDGYQSAYVCPLYFEMYKDKQILVDKLSGNLAIDVYNHNTHLTTGFLGTPFILFALADNGYLDLSYDLLLQDTFPSWLYQVKQGATTIWERWDSLRPDGFVEDNDEDINNMVSFNHYALGSVGDFLYRRVAGIEGNYQTPGFKYFTIAPLPGGNLTFARAKYHSIYGDIVSNWEIKNERFYLDVEIPCNTTANVKLPNGINHLVGSGKHHFEMEYLVNKK